MHVARKSKRQPYPLLFILNVTSHAQTVIQRLEMIRKWLCVVSPPFRLNTNDINQKSSCESSIELIHLTHIQCQKLHIKHIKALHLFPYKIFRLSYFIYQKLNVRQWQQFWLIANMPKYEYHLQNGNCIYIICDKFHFIVAALERISQVEKGEVKKIDEKSSTNYVWIGIFLARNVGVFHTFRDWGISNSQPKLNKVMISSFAPYARNK